MDFSHQVMTTNNATTNPQGHERMVEHWSTKPKNQQA
jgi:hypothetical protein